MPEVVRLALLPSPLLGPATWASVAAERDVRAIVFVDARLPQDDPTAAGREPAFRASLAQLADADGRLPAWTHWWPEAEVTELFPDDAARAAVEAEQLRLPLSYFDGVVPTPAGWRTLPAAYLAFGDTYAHERDLAMARGWPTRTLPGRHLHTLQAPHDVAEAILGLVRSLGL